MEPQTGQRIYIAPFQGITTVVFREVYTRHFSGTDKLFTAFFNGIHNEKSLRSKQREIEKTCHHGIPVVPQILSKDAGEILLFGKQCYDLGFNEINWNLGCPFPRVARKKRGSGLLPYPEEITEILTKIFPALPLKLSVKCRLGYNSNDEILKLIPVFNRFPLSEIIVHARLGRQMYKGSVQTGAFREALHLSAHKMVYNGDIFTPEGFQAFQQQFPEVNRWMLGRGLLADPFLPELIRGISPSAQPLLVIRKYVDDLYFAYRKAFNDNLRAISVMKEFWSYLSLSFDRPERVFNKIKKSTAFDGYEDAVNFALSHYVWQGKGGEKFL